SKRHNGAGGKTSLCPDARTGSVGLLLTHHPGIDTVRENWLTGRGAQRPVIYRIASGGDRSARDNAFATAPARQPNHPSLKRRPVMKNPLLSILFLTLCATPVLPRDPIPDRLVVLTFDDASKSHFTVARPLLKKYGFGATFFVTEGFD